MNRREAIKLMGGIIATGAIPAIALPETELPVKLSLPLPKAPTGTCDAFAACLEAMQIPSREQTTHMVNIATNRIKWDFNTSLGDTIKEKYENLYEVLQDFMLLLHNKLSITSRVMGVDWIVMTSPEIASIFETATCNFIPCPSNYYSESDYEEYNNGGKKVIYAGDIILTIGNMILYKDPLFTIDKILILPCPRSESVISESVIDVQYGVVDVENLVI